MISICIPTYNRAKLLENCLESITDQFNDKKVSAAYEVIISDNNSQDNTTEVVKKYLSKYRNFRYFKNKKNLGTQNTIKVTNYAKSDYIWFLADDDWLNKGALKKILKSTASQPDMILTNLDLYSKDGKLAVDPNLLRAKRDFFGDKKQFFQFLEDKFFLPIDWYLTTYSNTLVKRKVFIKNSYLLKKYSGKRFVFPQKYAIFFTSADFKISVLSDSLVNFRSDNRSFGSQNKEKFLVDWYKTLRIHYDKIYLINKKYISWKFTFLLLIKQVTRSLRLKFLLFFGIDISAFLIKLFYKRS